jgi:hypothetical protein
MSQIDLKHATIYIQDGYVGKAAVNGMLVNSMTGYTTGAVTMAVDGATGAVATGDRFTVAGDTVEHTITSHTESLSATTSITFTPGLGAAVLDNAIITWIAHQLEVNIGEGNCSYNEKRTIEYKKNRGKLGNVRQGDEDPVEVKIDAWWEFLRSVSGAVTPTIEEALKNIGPAASWVSSDSDLCRPYAVDIVILYVPPCSTEQKEKITLIDYRYETLEHDPKTGMLTTSGKCNVVEASVVRLM